MNVMKETLLREVHQMEDAVRPKEDMEKWRMRFHIMPPVGWLNDPNGLCFYKGKYYFFFQYAPFDPEGGLKMWGEYSSEDLLHWKYEGTPLLPDSPYDCHGVYSGSAFTEDGKMELFYTGNVKLDGAYDYINSGREANTVYTSSEDGKTFTEKECLLGMSDYPNEYTNHIRDPKVWKENEQYYMVLGGRKKNGQGAVLIYESADKKDWHYLKELTTSLPFGYMWECPDLFELEGTWILSVSPQGVERGAYFYQNIYQSGYFRLPEHWMKDDCSNDICKEEWFAEWDKGFDFYAPQTFRDESGRRILVAWAGMPDCEGEYTNPTVADGWQHVFTTPRALTIKSGKVYQYPVEEICRLRNEETVREWRADGQPQAVKIEDSCFDWEITDICSNDLRITIEQDCSIEYQDGVFSLSFSGSLGGGRKERKAKVNKLDEVRILADTSLLEVYLNGGEFVFTSRYYPEGEIRRITFEGRSGENRIYELKRDSSLIL